MVVVQLEIFVNNFLYNFSAVFIFQESAQSNQKTLILDTNHFKLCHSHGGTHTMWLFMYTHIQCKYSRK